MINKIKIWANSFENKSIKILAFWGALTGIVALFPAILGFIFWCYTFACDLYHISKYVREFKNAVEYNHFMVQQLASVVHGETDSKVIYGIDIEQTNLGDNFIWSTVEVNGIIRTIIYSANIKQKPDALTGSHIYVQTMDGKHKWINK